MNIEVLPDYAEPYWATFTIGKSNHIIVSNAITHLELADIFVNPNERNNGYGTILMICALGWAREQQLDLLRGIYHPRGNILKTEQWYKDIGATFEGKWVRGSVKEMYDRCQMIKGTYQVDFRLNLSE